MDSSDNNLLIRPATIDELEDILTIEREGFSADGFNQHQMRYLIKSPTVDFFLATLNQKTVGYAIALSRSNSLQLRLYSLAVSETARGQGVGQALLDWAEKLAKQKGKNRIKLEVNAANTGAIRLYQKNQFQSTKVIASYYKDGGDALVMVRKL